jgi:hypothetical protein
MAPARPASYDMSGSMSGDGKRGVAERPKLPRPSSTGLTAGPSKFKCVRPFKQWILDDGLV